VIDVLTHENRPHMADNDQAYKDDVAPAGSPFRPLYDDKIMFSGQPIALVIAETSEIARFAASLVRVEYDREAHVTDVFVARDTATPVKPPSNPFEALFAPPKPRVAADRALAAAPVRHVGE
jgi:xanthine dehydrogenase YagR molybdenum-binding subunit